MDPTCEQHILDLARRQHGLVSRAQLLHAGLSAQMIGRRVRARRLDRLGAGVYRLSGAARTAEQAVLAACLAGPSLTVASHRSALWLWSLARPPTRPEVSTTAAWRPTGDGVDVHRTSSLDDGEVTVRRGVPVTRPDRTLLDAGAVLDADEVAAAVERAVVRGLVSVASLQRVLARSGGPGRVGTAALRTAVAERLDLGATESPLERRFGRICRSFRLPLPRPQFEVVIGGRRYRLDFAFIPERVVVELDGFAVHGERDVWRADLRRQNALHLDGWLVLRFSADDLYHHPQQVAETVRAVLAERANLANLGV